MSEIWTRFKTRWPDFKVNTFCHHCVLPSCIYFLNDMFSNLKNLGHYNNGFDSLKYMRACTVCVISVYKLSLIWHALHLLYLTNSHQLISFRYWIDVTSYYWELSDKLQISARLPHQPSWGLHSLLSHSIEVIGFHDSHLFYLLNLLLISGNYWLKFYKNDRLTTSAMLSLCVTFQVNIYREYKQGNYTYETSGYRKNMVQ